MSLSLPDLDSHLFKCADIIRDAVDPTDYKEFILPLVYYKAISDEYEKQYKKNVEKYGDEDLARRPRLRHRDEGIRGPQRGRAIRRSR
nr:MULTISPECIES: type I restriction-modification system subunit M N-terminal domain-containing protein [Halorubrum]